MAVLDALSDLTFVGEATAYKLTPKEEKVAYDDGSGVEVKFYDGDEYIGKCATCEFEGVPNAFLHGFEVKAKYRGKGYGTQILKYMLRKYNCRVLYVVETNRAVNLYKRFGFKQTGKFSNKVIIMRR